MKKLSLLFVFALLAVLCVLSLSSCTSRFGDFVFEHANGEVTIVGYRGNDEHIVVPESIDGMTVVSIADSAFPNENIRSIVLPDSVVYIANCAFIHCDALERIVLGQGIRKIYPFVFHKSDKMIYNQYENGYYLGSEENPYMVLISVADKDSESFSFHPDTVVIGGSAFEACSLLREIRIPEGILSIGDAAFSNCPSLETLYLPKSLENVYSPLFSKCESLLEINVSEENLYFKSINGSLFSRDGAHLIKYATGKKDSCYRIPDDVTVIDKGAFEGAAHLNELVLHDGVEVIGRSAFRECRSLRSIYLGNSIKTIDVDTFYNCVSLAEITIPEGVEKIEYSAFMGCDSLTEITVPDSVQEIGSGAFYGCDKLERVVIGCGVTLIDPGVFSGCKALREIVFSDPAGWRAAGMNISPQGKIDVSDPKINAENFTGEYTQYWCRKKTYFYDYIIDLFM